MAVRIPHELSFNRTTIVIRVNLTTLNDTFELVLPFPVRQLTSMERALGTTVATTTTVVSGTLVIGSDGKGVNFQTLQTLSTLGTPASVSTHTVLALKGELTALNGTGGVELIIVGASD